MTQETLTKLTKLQRYPTRYELVLSKGDTRARIAYVQAHSASALLSFARNNIAEILAYTGIDRDGEVAITWLKPIALGGTIGPVDNQWTIRFSGRTQRSAISEGDELPWIGTPSKVAA